ncbi:hypothetical protein M9978_08240 [Sphingomonas sp. MG17]|uniref:Uncharacterized protein n=1 Tax=Sphingomonas tagetis TaxID=2949092 RepID=A0A9X2HKM7_9SPHN|nr:hypothetical protein [Sphingomonas tagetis]MCP3730416.1 hypothetical protein [Sphingomonas tagetis]
MEEGGAFSIDFMMLVCAAIGVGRAFELGKVSDAPGHAVLRLVLLAMVALIALGGATHWRHVLYGTLMPLGAYYLARSIAEPIAAWRARTKVDS